MKYDLKNKSDKDKAVSKFKELLDRKAIIDLSEERPIRSISSNSYLHVLFSLWGIHYGHTLKEAKIEVKVACPFTEYDTKTSLMNDVEIISFIEWFRNYAAMNNENDDGCYLCSPQEYKAKKTYFDNEIKKHKVFL